MASSVTEALSHDKNSGGRSVTGVLGNVTGKEQKCNWGMEVRRVYRHKSVMGLYQFMV